MDALSGLVLLLLGCKVMTTNPWGILWAGLQAKEASLIRDQYQIRRKSKHTQAQNAAMC